MKSQMMEMQWTETETMWVNEHFWSMISCLDERLKVLDYLMNHRAGKYALWNYQRNFRRNRIERWQSTEISQGSGREEYHSASW